MNLNDTSKWIRFSPRLCQQCRAWCCHLPLEVTFPELVRLGLASADEIEAPFLGGLLKRLRAERAITQYDAKAARVVLAPTPSGGCRFLDSQQRCSIYPIRPQTCRNFPHVPPFNGRCPYGRT